MKLIPIKVQIGLRPNGHADHPDWSTLPLAAREDPATHMFHGWKYDKTSGHTESTADSAFGVQFGLVLVTPQFAVEALATFPTLIKVLTEAELETFWDDKAHGHLPPDRVDLHVLQALNIERQLQVSIGEPTVAIDARIGEALDPNDPHPGKRKDHMRRWSDAKRRLDVTIGTLP